VPSKIGLNGTLRLIRIYTHKNRYNLAEINKCIVITDFNSSSVTDAVRRHTDEQQTASV